MVWVITRWGHPDVFLDTKEIRKWPKNFQLGKKKFGETSKTGKKNILDVHTYDHVIMYHCGIIENSNTL